METQSSAKCGAVDHTVKTTPYNDYFLKVLMMVRWIVFLLLGLLAIPGYRLASMLDVPSVPRWSSKLQAKEVKILGFVDGGKTLLVTSSLSGPGSLWGFDVTTGKLTFTDENYVLPAYRTEGSKTSSVDFHGLLNSGDHLAMSESKFNEQLECIDRQLMICETKTGAMKFRTLLAIDCHPLNAVVVARSANLLVLKQFNPTNKAPEFQVLEAQTGQLKRILSPKPLPIVELHDISPDGKILAHFEVDPASGGGLMLTDIASGDTILKLTDPGTYRLQFHRDSESFTVYQKVAVEGKPVHRSKYFVMTNGQYNSAMYKTIEQPVSEQTLSVPGWSILVTTVEPEQFTEWQKRMYKWSKGTLEPYKEWQFIDPRTGDIKFVMHRPLESGILDEAAVDGSLLATCENDKTLSLWELPAKPGPSYGKTGLLLGFIPMLLFGVFCGISKKKLISDTTK